MTDAIMIDTNCNSIISYSFGRIAIFLLLSFLPLVLISYIIYQLFKTMRQYILVKTEFLNKLSMTKVSPLYRSDNDNEVYINQDLIKDKDFYEKNSYKNITTNIENTLKEAESYNQAVEKYLKVVHKSDPIDVIDKTSLLESNDNW